MAKPDLHQHLADAASLYKQFDNADLFPEGDEYPRVDWSDFIDSIESANHIEYLCRAIYGGRLGFLAYTQINDEYISKVRMSKDVLDVRRILAKWKNARDKKHQEEIERAKDIVVYAPLDYPWAMATDNEVKAIATQQLTYPDFGYTVEFTIHEPDPKLLRWTLGAPTGYAGKAKFAPIKPGNMPTAILITDPEVRHGGINAAGRPFTVYRAKACNIQ